MSKIWKYPIKVDHRELLMMPKGAKVLSFKIINEFPVIFALVDPEAPPAPRVFRCVTTGEQFNDSILDFIGTEVGAGWFTAHLFEVVGKAEDPIDPRWVDDYKAYHEELSPV